MGMGMCLRHHNAVWMGMLMMFVVNVAMLVGLRLVGMFVAVFFP